jgi:hypothetical protein
VGDGREPRGETLEIGSAEGAEDAGDGIVHVRRVEDGALLSIPTRDAAALFPDELALRARKALEVKTSDFQSIRVVGPLGTERLVRAPGGQWTFAEPALALTPDAGLVADLLEAVGELNVERWVGAARPEYGLDAPRLTIRAEVGSGKTARTIEIALGATVGTASAYARISGDPAVFVAPPALERAASRWMVDRMSLLVDVARAGAVTLTKDGKRHEVLRAGVAASGAEKARDALRDLTADATVSVGPPPASQGFAKPSLVITVEQGKSRFEIRLGARETYRSTPVYLARRDGIDATFAVAESRVQPLLEAF